MYVLVLYFVNMWAEVTMCLYSDGNVAARHSALFLKVFRYS